LTIQEVIEAALLKILKTPTSVNGCGRTDAGVHASQYFFHSDLDENAVEGLLFKLNRALPPDISVFAVIPVHDRASARFDAVLRSYDYFIHRRKDPFLQAGSALYSDMELDIPGMKAAVALLPQYEDYYAFCKSPANFKHTICRVSAAHLWEDPSGDRLRFQISANRFLTGMIRIIVGRLLEIGTGRMSLEAFEAHLRDKKTPRIITGAHPQGLYLSKVVYPYLDLPQGPVFSELFGENREDYWV
jgi:tRNA pseudouridine38-40 synthase